MLKKNIGVTLIELIIVIALITVIGGTLMTILDVGGKHYKEATEVFDNQSEARIAMAFITTSLRQNDTGEGINITPNPGSSLIIKKSSGDISFYYEDGYLKTNTKTIAKIKKVLFEKHDSSIDITIWYGNRLEPLKSTITLRSEQFTGG